MERVLSTDERIRRAEEIYQRRNANIKTKQARISARRTKNELKII